MSLSRNEKKKKKELVASTERCTFDLSYEPYHNDDDDDDWLQPGCVNTTELDVKKACRSHKPTLRSIEHLELGIAGGKISPQSESYITFMIESLEKEIDMLKDRLDRRNIKVSKVAEA